jgi:hypothetical protein
VIPYIRNKNCACVRCRAQGLMPAAVLITLGVLGLLDSYRVVPMHNSIPVLLLVIGCVLLVSRTGSTEGHVQPGWIEAAPMPPPQPWAPNAVPPPPPPTEKNDSQVKP